MTKRIYIEAEKNIVKRGVRKASSVAIAFALAATMAMYGTPVAFADEVADESTLATQDTPVRPEAYFEDDASSQVVPGGSIVWEIYDSGAPEFDDDDEVSFDNPISWQFSVDQYPDGYESSDGVSIKVVDGSVADVPFYVRAIAADPYEELTEDETKSETSDLDPIIDPVDYSAGADVSDADAAAAVKSEAQIEAEEAAAAAAAAAAAQANAGSYYYYDYTDYGNGDDQAVAAGDEAAAEGEDAEASESGTEGDAAENADKADAAEGEGAEEANAETIEDEDNPLAAGTEETIEDEDNPLAEGPISSPTNWITWAMVGCILAMIAYFATATVRRNRSISSLQDILR